MELQTINISTREESGKGPARRRRVTGSIPAVMYGEKKGVVSVMVNAKAFVSALHGSQGEHAIMQANVEDKPELSGPVLVKAVQHHPVKEHIIHADLLRIDLAKPIHTLVPLALVGQCPGIVEGGVPDQPLRELEIECLPLDTPAHLDVDISELRIGGLLHVADLKVPDNIKVVTDPDRTIITIHPPRVVAVAEAPADGKKGKKK
ncbi:MAG: 50S ribosomal protein L25 [Candidatus Hydrogenedentes bacterium]|nr:50S ribosomal protein L25 [Candidatus Hydrogenedentota bacterium]